MSLNSSINIEPENACLIAAKYLIYLITEHVSFDLIHFCLLDLSLLVYQWSELKIIFICKAVELQVNYENSKNNVGWQIFVKTSPQLKQVF